MEYVEWVEPYSKDDSVVLTCRLTKVDAIKAQRAAAFFANPTFVYESDQQALEDFLTVHWAKLIICNQ